MVKNRIIFFVMVLVIALPAFSQDRDRGERPDSRRPSAAEVSGKITFSVVNETGFTIKSVFVCRQDDEDWGINYLDTLLNPQERLVISIENFEKGTLYKVRVQDKDGDFYTKLNIALRERGTIKMDINDYEF